MNKTPKLRFKEFSGDWESKKLGELGEFKNGVNKSKEDFGHGYPFINLMDVFGKNSIENGKFELVNATDKELKESNLLKGDVLFVRSSVKPSGVGMTSVVLEDLNNTVYSGFLIRFRDNNSLDLYFKKYCFYNKKFRMELISKSSTSANTNINQESLKLLNINVPSKEEQEKIASFFSLIDDKISLQGEKVEALKDYNKGMMQKIFSRELKFKDDDGRDYPEWEEKKLGNLIKVKSNRNKNNEIDLVLSISNTKGFIAQSEQFEDKTVASSDVSNYKIVEKDDFAFNPARINVGSIAKLKLYNKGIISPMYICFKCLNILDNDYLEYFLMTHSFDVQMKKKLEGSVRQTLSSEALGEIVIDLPCIEEQKKIGEVLSTINTKIEKEQEKLDSLNEYKKGLLQQMFV